MVVQQQHRTPRATQHALLGGGPIRLTCAWSNIPTQEELVQQCENADAGLQHLCVLEGQNAHLFLCFPCVYPEATFVARTCQPERVTVCGRRLYRAPAAVTANGTHHSCTYIACKRCAARCSLAVSFSTITWPASAAAAAHTASGSQQRPSPLTRPPSHASATFLPARRPDTHAAC